MVSLPSLAFSSPFIDAEWFLYRVVANPEIELHMTPRGRRRVLKMRLYPVTAREHPSTNLDLAARFPTFPRLRCRRRQMQGRIGL